MREWSTSCIHTYSGSSSLLIAQMREEGRLLDLVQVSSDGATVFWIPFRYPPLIDVAHGAHLDAPCL